MKVIIMIGLLITILISGCVSEPQDKYTDYGKIEDFEIHKSFWGTSCTVKTNITKAYIEGSWCHGIDINKHYLVWIKEGGLEFWGIKEEGEGR